MVKTAQPRWVEDVRARKLTIASGEGTVHGSDDNLDEQYGIRLKPVRSRLAGGRCPSCSTQILGIWWE